MAVCECVPDPGALELFDTQRTDIGESVRALPGFRWVAQRAGTPSTGWAVADWQTSRPPPAVAVWAHRNGASAGRSAALPRSEEHTSELQSRGHLVCRLLLE